MDRHKYRVWDGYDNEYRYWSFDDCEQPPYHPTSQSNEDIEQCTGLKDKNGVLIYEGDVVRYYAYGRWITKKIHWNGRWYQLGDADIILCEMEIEDYSIEVIGNIHENPELLT